MNRCARLTVLLLPLLLLFALPAGVSAHAHLVRADLAPDSHLRISAGTVHFWFDEPINPSLSRIIIRDASGRQVNTDTGTLDPANSEQLDMGIPTLADGQYTVTWTSDSAQDGHILHGFYLFTVGGADAAAPSAEPASVSVPQDPTLDTPALAVAFSHWLVLVACAIWTGALAFDFLVLARARKRPGTALAQFSTLSGARAIAVARWGLLGTLAASILELEAQAYAADGWGGLVSTATLGDLLSAHYGTYWIAGIVLAFLTLLVLGPGSSWPLFQTTGERTPPSGLVVKVRPATRTAISPLTATATGSLALLYLLSIALSGHASAVPQLALTSVLFDWLHLLAMSIWVGGMAAIALVLVPLIQRSGLEEIERRRAYLTLLDRFSPAAYLAVATAAFTGMFNTQVHLGSLDQLTGTAYGRFLLIKLLLILELCILSASHVFVTRPQIRQALGRPRPGSLAADFASLAMRLRVEPIIGAFILLCVSLMGQVAPASPLDSTVASTASARPTSTPVPVAPHTISATASKGALAVSLSISPPSVGLANFVVTVRENGTPVTDGQVRIRLSVPGQPTLGSVFVETTGQSGGYRGSGDLVQTGHWQAGVEVRTHSDPLEFREVPFDFVAGPQPLFLTGLPHDTAYGSAQVRLFQPQGAPSTLSVQLHPGLSVRYIVSMRYMAGMPDVTYPAKSTGGDFYSAAINFPMEGIAALDVQVQVNNAWHTMRTLVYQVNGAFQATLLNKLPGDL